MNVTDAVKLCDQLSKDIDPSSRAAAYRSLAETVYTTGLFSTPFIFNLEMGPYQPIRLHFEFKGTSARTFFASLKVHVFQCCCRICDLGTEPLLFAILCAALATGKMEVQK